MPKCKKDSAIYLPYTRRVYKRTVPYRTITTLCGRPAGTAKPLQVLDSINDGIRANGSVGQSSDIECHYQTVLSRSNNDSSVGLPCSSTMIPEHTHVQLITTLINAYLRFRYLIKHSRVSTNRPSLSDADRLEMRTVCNLYLELVKQDVRMLRSIIQPNCGDQPYRGPENTRHHIYLLVLREDPCFMSVAYHTLMLLAVFNTALSYSYICYDDLNDVREQMKYTSVPCSVYIFGHGTKTTIGYSDQSDPSRFVIRNELLQCIDHCFSVEQVVSPIASGEERSRQRPPKPTPLTTVILADCFGHSDSYAFSHIRVVALASKIFEKVVFTGCINIQLFYYILNSRLEKLCDCD